MKQREEQARRSVGPSRAIIEVFDAAARAAIPEDSPAGSSGSTSTSTTSGTPARTKAGARRGRSSG